MKSKVVLLLAFFISNLVMFGQVQQAKSGSLSEKEKIEKLILSIETLKGCQFYRNGSWYSAADAASHLRMKLGKAGSSVKTARDFIDKIASSSSMSGEAYKIKMSDGKVLTTHDFLYGKLKEIESLT